MYTLFAWEAPVSASSTTKSTQRDSATPLYGISGFNIAGAIRTFS